MFVPFILNEGFALSIGIEVRLITNQEGAQ